MILAPADRAAWLEARRRGIGASEAAAVLGIVLKNVGVRK